jgi:hypothetical protein
MQQVINKTDIKSVNILFYYIVACLLKAIIVQQRQPLLGNSSVNMSIAWQWLSSHHVKATTDTHTTRWELLKVVVFVWSISTLYNMDQLPLLASQESAGSQSVESCRRKGRTEDTSLCVIVICKVYQRVQ